jgi:hypothetical protein
MDKVQKTDPSTIIHICIGILIYKIFVLLEYPFVILQYSDARTLFLAF